MTKDRNKPVKKKGNDDAIVKPDPETLHTTDPEEHMKGPISSLMQDIMKEAEKEDGPENDKH